MGTKNKGTKRLIEEANVPIHEVNIGATAQRSGENLIQVNRFVTIDEQEKQIYLALMEKGVRIYAKYLVADPEIDFKTILK